MPDFARRHELKTERRGAYGFRVYTVFTQKRTDQGQEIQVTEVNPKQIKP